MVRNVIRALEPDRPQSTPALEPLVDLGRTRLEMVLKVLDVDGAVRRVKGGWVGTGEPWNYDEPRYRSLDEARKREQQAMLDYQDTDGCRMAFLRSQLDDPELGEGERCGRCDNCTGVHISADVDATDAQDTRQRLMRPGVELTPRKQWPSGLSKLGVHVSGKIGDGPAPGRVIGRLTDLGWGARLRHLLDEPDGEVSDDVVQAAVEVLASWDWATPADRGAGAGLGSPSAADLVAGPRARPTRQADRPRHPAVRARAPAGHRGQFGLSSRRAERVVAGARSGRRRRGRRAGAAGRRPDRHRVDADDGGPRRARGGRAGGAAVRVGQHQLTSNFRLISNTTADLNKNSRQSIRAPCAAETP